MVQATEKILILHFYTLYALGTCPKSLDLRSQISNLRSNTALYLNRIDLKEETERHVHLPNRTNRDAYSVVRFINIISISVNISIRIFGLFAIGAMGRQFAYTEFESSDRRESFTGCLAYTCSMLILLAAYYMGIIRMVSHDLLMHSLLAILGGVFIAFSLQPHDTYSKELNQI
ncbi:hypothetical protein SSS_05933 [Sarcoptes scabiei]|uniref:Uncharacterized protein n=1 Tax=Sarcoptes scabiei TaxID=52283 RepID=A0A834RDW9_SARSC|nr:hypothetical protein SSS_05933 [Sarcoptes scabiei]